MRYVDESLMISFLAVYEFCNIHKSIGMLLQKIATNTSAIGCFLHFSSLGRKSTSLLRERKNGQDVSVGWAILLMPPSGYMADCSSILSL